MIPGRFQGAERFSDIPEARREACPRSTEGLGATEEMGWDPELGDEEVGTTLMDGGSLPTMVFLLLLRLVGTSLRARCRLLRWAEAPAWRWSCPAVPPAAGAWSQGTKLAPVLPWGTGPWGKSGW